MEISIALIIFVVYVVSCMVCFVTFEVLAKGNHSQAGINEFLLAFTPILNTFILVFITGLVIIDFIYNE